MTCFWAWKRSEFPQSHECSMYGIFTYIYHELMVKIVDKYSMEHMGIVNPHIQLSKQKKRALQECSTTYYLHPGRLTWNIDGTYNSPILENEMIFQTSVNMSHVNLQGCNWIFTAESSSKAYFLILIRWMEWKSLLSKADGLIERHWPVHLIIPNTPGWAAFSTGPVADGYDPPSWNITIIKSTPWGHDMNQPMVNGWFGARWFGARGTLKNPNPFHFGGIPGIPTQTYPIYHQFHEILSFFKKIWRHLHGCTRNLGFNGFFHLLINGIYEGEITHWVSSYSWGYKAILSSFGCSWSSRIVRVYYWRDKHSPGGGWTNPFEKICDSQIGSFPQFSGWN